MDEIVIQKRKLTDALPYFAGGAVCVLLLLAVFAVKGIFPFGGGSIAIMDMCHGYIPVYYHLYDFLHGGKSLFFDWFSGAGVNMAGVAAVNGLLSPLNLLFYFVPRDGIEPFMGIFLLVKVFFAALTSAFFFRRRFPKMPGVYAVVFSALYALSGYVLLYYMHIIWLDVVILFPLLVYYCEKAMRGGRVFPYALCVFLTRLGSLYLGVMALIAVFFVAGAYLLIVMEKQERGRAAFRLGLGTALGALLPMFLLVPGYMQMTSSSRYGYTGTLTDILSAAPTMNTFKTLIFSFLQLAFLLVFLLMLRFKKHRNVSLFAAVTMLILYLPFVIEGSAMLWHFGSYKDFPYRFGFASIFLLLALAAYCVNENGDEVHFSFPQPLAYLLAIPFIGVLAYENLQLYRAGTQGGENGRPLSAQNALKISALLFAAGLCAFLAVLLIRQTFVKRAVVFLVCVAQILPVALFSIGSGSGVRYERREHDTEYIAPALEVAALSQADNSLLQRIHDPDMSLNINYGFVMGVGALSNWTHQIPAQLQNARKALGYSTTYTLLLDGGGTVFSDALLNMTETVSKRELNRGLYLQIGQTDDGYRLYQNYNVLPAGMLADSPGMGFSSSVAGNGNIIFRNQNEIFRALGGKGTLIRTTENSSDLIVKESSDGQKLTYVLSAGALEVLYFTSPSSAWNSMRIFVNGKPVPVPSYHKDDNDLYTSEYNNNCLELGYFSREQVTVEIRLLSDGAMTQEFAFGMLSVDKMKELAALQKQYGIELRADKYTVLADVQNAPADRYLLLPVSYDEGWSARINGVSAEVEQAAGYLCAVRVPAGASSVKLVFAPRGMILGAAVSGASLVLFCVLMFLEMKKGGVPRVKLLETASLVLLSAGWFAAVFAVYALPMVYSVIGVFR